MTGGPHVVRDAELGVSRISLTVKVPGSYSYEVLSFLQFATVPPHRQWPLHSSVFSEIHTFIICRFSKLTSLSQVSLLISI